NPEHVLLRDRKQPARLALTAVLGRGIFVEAVRHDQAPPLARRIAELAPLAAIIEDRLAGRPGPAPAALDQLGRLIVTLHPADERARIGDPDRLERREIRRALREAERDAQLGEGVGDLPQLDLAAMFVAHQKAS